MKKTNAQSANLLAALTASLIPQPKLSQSAYHSSQPKLELISDMTRPLKRKGGKKSKPKHSKSHQTTEATTATATPPAAPNAPLSALPHSASTATASVRTELKANEDGTVGDAPRHVYEAPYNSTEQRELRAWYLWPDMYAWLDDMTEELKEKEDRTWEWIRCLVEEVKRHPHDRVKRRAAREKLRWHKFILDDMKRDLSFEVLKVWWNAHVRHYHLIRVHTQQVARRDMEARPSSKSPVTPRVAATKDDIDKDLLERYGTKLRDMYDQLQPPLFAKHSQAPTHLDPPSIVFDAQGIRDQLLHCHDVATQVQAMYMAYEQQERCDASRDPKFVAVAATAAASSATASHTKDGITYVPVSSLGPHASSLLEKVSMPSHHHRRREAAPKKSSKQSQRKRNRCMPYIATALGIRGLDDGEERVDDDNEEDQEIDIFNPLLDLILKPAQESCERCLEIARDVRPHISSNEFHFDGVMLRLRKWLTPFMSRSAPSAEALRAIADAIRQSGEKGVLELESRTGYWSFCLSQLRCMLVQSVDSGDLPGPVDDIKVTPLASSSPPTASAPSPSSVAATAESSAPLQSSTSPPLSLSSSPTFDWTSPMTQSISSSRTVHAASEVERCAPPKLSGLYRPLTEPVSMFRSVCMGQANHMALMLVWPDKRYYWEFIRTINVWTMMADFAAHGRAEQWGLSTAQGVACKQTVIWVGDRDDPNVVDLPTLLVDREVQFNSKNQMQIAEAVQLKRSTWKTRCVVDLPRWPEDTAKDQMYVLSKECASPTVSSTESAMQALQATQHILQRGKPGTTGKSHLDVSFGLLEMLAQAQSAAAASSSSTSGTGTTKRQRTNQ